MFYEGQKVRCLDTVTGQFTKGQTYTVDYSEDEIDGYTHIVADDKGIANGWLHEFFESAKTPSVASDLKLKPQAKTVLRHLKAHGRISPGKADRVYGFTRLAAQIHEIKKVGYDVVTTLKRDEQGHQYAEYRLAA